MSNYIRKITNSLKQSIDMLAKDPSKFYETPMIQKRLGYVIT